MHAALFNASCSVYIAECMKFYRKVSLGGSRDR